MAVSKTTRRTNLSPLLRTHELHIACRSCCKQKAEITFCVVEQSHQCQRNIVLARQIGKDHWRPINPLPQFPTPMKYEVCWHFKEGFGCISHGKRCSFARSSEEATVWNFLKNSVLDYSALIHLLKQGTKPPSQTQAPTGGTANFLSKFPGKFLELCRTCFHSSPQRISRKQSGEPSPSCTSKHPWRPLLVHCKVTQQKSEEYHEIRPLPNKPFSEWRYCRFVLSGQPCWHGGNRCWFAHSEVEMAVWTEEIQGPFDRSRLLGNDVQKSQRPARNSTPPVKQQKQSTRMEEHYCKVCQCKFRSREDYMNHCFTSEHRQRIFEDGVGKGQFRDPPQTCHSFKMCQRPYNCEYGDRCLEAHSDEELKEWRLRVRTARKKANAAEEQGLLSYQDRLLEEYRTSSHPEYIISETVSGVETTCDSELFKNVQKEKVPLTWKFTVASENALAEIALLKQEPGASFTLGESNSEQRTYSTGDWYLSTDSQYNYEVTVSFMSTSPGVYEQWLVFDFDTRPVLLHKLLVRVAMQSSPQLMISEQYTVPTDPVPPNLKLWNRGNKVIVPYFCRDEAEIKLLKEFEPPVMNRRYCQQEDCDSINHFNYKERMHDFLYQEEQAEEEIVCRLNLHDTITLSNTLKDIRFGLKIACDGELFGAISVCHALTPDTPEGFMLKRGVVSVLVGEVTANDEIQKVYEALILKDTSSVNKIHIKLSKECCLDLGLQVGQTHKMEVQFQLNRLWFCEMHKAIDLLPDLQYVLPDFNKTCVPEHALKNPLLNEKQQAAMGFILGETDSRDSVAPLLIYGPFGTGKTFTLAAATVELMKGKHNRVLICTHTNSSADLYVKDHFHKHIMSGNLKIKPLRIKAKEVSPISTDPTTRQYCLLTEDGWYFKFPDKDTLDLTRIIITTTGVARLLHDLKLPKNYFSHIMIDEASQMLECEALMALGLAGPKTRVVLAGDHMQMGPKLFSVDDHKRSDHTLLNRLFYYYQSEKKDVALKSRVIFNENYRSTKGIVDFVSTYFYFNKCEKKQAVNSIKASGDVAAHPTIHPLVFSHVRGECHLDTTTMSWYNLEEIAVVVNIIQELLHNWPVVKWKEPDSSAICILSQGTQVYHLRNTLKQVNLRWVTVENAENVQGKQFRVIIIVTVHTRDTLKSSAPNCLEFFNDARVLNTAMTRAQSQVIVVGDAAALCYFGKCAKTWRCYVEHCIENNGAMPEHLTKDFLNQEVMEISRFVPIQEEDTSDTDSTTSEMPDIDPILQELLDESNDLKVNVTEEGLLDIFKNDDTDKTPDEFEEEYHVDQSDSTFLHLNGVENEIPSIPKTNVVCKRCTIVMERFDSAYAIPLDEPTSRINISGRNNVRCCFPGDEVFVEVLNDECTPPTGRVHIPRAGTASLANKLFICTIEKNDNQVMTPINKCISKIYTPFCKNKPHHIAVRKPEDFKPQSFVKINEESKRNHLFVVQVLKWRNNFRYPLGIVVEVLPKVASLEDGLKVLNIEYKLSKCPSLTEQEMIRLQECSQDLNKRRDFRNIITFTIDPSHSQDLDDAISVRDLGPDYEIGIHIADVAHFVPKGSERDERAKQQGLVFYPPGTPPVYMFPKELSEDQFSLLPNCDRHTISLMVVIDKKTNCIKSTDFFLSMICSNRKLSYEDAEKILQNARTKPTYSEPCFNTVEGCLLIASNFSEVHRKDRKQEDWCYKSPDEDSVIGRRQSHRVVEELMILFNHSVAQLLLQQEETKSFVPLRCQERPDLTQLRERCRAWLPLSIHLSHLMEDEGSVMSLPEAGRTMSSSASSIHQQHDTDRTAFLRYTSVKPDTLSVLTSTLENLQTAVGEGDIERIVDLIATDDIHPQLLPIIRAFRKLIRRAHVIRSNSTLTSRVGHFDLDLDCYSWASSPIRRYVDIITHRILHSVLEGKGITYSPTEIDQACVNFSLQYSQQSKYDRISHSLNLASELREKSARKIAYISDMPPNSNSFRLSFPLLRQSICDDVAIMYRDLQLAEQPEYDRQQNCCIITWNRRVYSFLRDDIHSDLKRQVPNSLITQVSKEAWECLLSTIREEKWENMLEHVQDITSQVRQDTFSSMEPSKGTGLNWIGIESHFVELSLRLRQGDTIEVQLGTDRARGMLVPAIQLLIVNPHFEICLEHTKNPIECFSKYALRASKDVYPTYNDYQKIWTPLCEMESACNAVAENESIVLEDVHLTWTQTRGEHLQGFFQISREKKKQWSIECDFRKCLLCVRMRRLDNDFQPEKNYDGNRLTEAKYLHLTNMTNVIWIAHGVTTKVEEEEEEEEEKNKDDTNMKIHFRINHLPMTSIPQRIFMESTTFTVELIPKLLPDVRKEEAVKRLTKANQLVKDIALGKRIHLEGINIKNQSGAFDMPDHHALSFPRLNRSQTTAIREALQNRFTLIQGPPGTGKTVVGVHIVYWFFQQSKKEVPRRNKKERHEAPKKSCILYCGPSNKSVDVVAGQLLKLSKRGVLRPLRVYSEQMEVLEYPYPGSSLKLSRHSLREGRQNQDLRSITLHHRMRMPENPHSSEIRAFDARIRRGDSLSDEEIKSYKRVLQAARKHELLKHDVILCTCTAASNPNFANAKLNPQQIIIDECAMATEPEALIPFVNHQPEQIVLIGDHKQLKPVVSTEVVERLGMGKSLFERYMEKALMLDIQYRMHEDICEFPSQQFYDGQLKTGRRPHAKPSVLLTELENPTAILFGHVEGKEVSLVVATERGNENSRANAEEAEQTVRLAVLLINQSGVNEEQIAILTPYNAQVAKIKEALLQRGIFNVTVSTIMKSQGSEWRYVILSTVRSCPKSEIDEKPTKSWLLKKLGFIMDPNQVNVGITRAQEGLCIIGNQTLLQSSYLWRKLLNHYHEKGCVVSPAQRIRVQKRKVDPRTKSKLLF